MNAATLKQNKWVRRAAYVVLGVLLVWLLAWLLVPPIARSQIQKIASEKLGRAVSVGRIDFKPWSLELTLENLRIATADGSRDQLSIARIYADAELQSVFRLGPVIDQLAIDTPKVLLTHEADGKYDIDDILAKLAAAPKKPEDDKGEAPRFAIYNITLTGGSADFDDRTVKRQHELRDLTLNIPFLSNLPSQREIKTAPKLAFVLNGSRFDSAGESTPFAASRKTDLTLKFNGLDLAPYLGYVPQGLPFAVKSGKLDAELKLDFEQAANAGLKLSGTVAAQQIEMQDASGRELLRFDALRVSLADVRPLERFVHLGEVTLQAPRLVVARDASGRLNLVPRTAPAAEATPAPAKPEASPAQPPESASSPPKFQLQLDKFSLADGQVGWRDATTQPPASQDLKQLAVELDELAWPFQKPARFKGSARLAEAKLEFQGEATDQAARAQVELDGLPLAAAAPYLNPILQPSVEGQLSGLVEVDWKPAGLKLVARRAAIDGLALRQDDARLASIGRFELADAAVDLNERKVDVGSIKASAARIDIERGADKRWMFERWLKTPDAAPDAGGSAGTGDATGNTASRSAEGEPAKRAGPTTPAKPWSLSFGNLALDKAAVGYSDKSGSQPVAFELSALDLVAQKLVLPASATPFQLQLAGRISSGRTEPGRFSYQGNVAAAPLATEGRLELVSIPAHAFKNYYADALNIDIRRALANFKGTLKFAMTPDGPSVQVAGDTALEDFRANSASLTQSPGAERGNQILRWKALNLRAVQFSLQPKKPPALSVRETTLTDFFARVIIDPTGRLNLQDLTRKPGDPAPASTAAVDTPPAAKTRRGAAGTRVTSNAASPAAGARASTIPAEEMVGGGPAASPAPRAAAATPAARADAPVIDFGPMNLVNGRIDFTDLFVKPNYSADLSELTGKLSGFASGGQGGKPALADLELRGKAQQTAPLEITGKINPLAKPLELDITARMRELDLPPLSPYSVRYAGHGIERGKLSMDVNYKIDEAGRLTATNKLVLNQLQFGEEVQGAPNSLPVRLAVALLADRNGVIDIDFPISGSLNDPQFSLGPLIFKAIANLVVKAVAAPFSLLTGGLGGGSGQSSTVTFAPGSAMLSATARESLDKVAKALIEREQLRLTVVGTASLEQEREAAKRERLRAMAQAEKRRAAARSNQDASQVAPLTDAEYPALLAAVYQRTELEGKPRNLIGMAKEVPLAEMEERLLATVSVDEEQIRQLALARGAAVRDYLLEKKLPSERLFLGAVKTRATGPEWKPGAELDLSAR